MFKVCQWLFNIIVIIINIMNLYIFFLKVLVIIV